MSDQAASKGKINGVALSRLIGFTLVAAISLSFLFFQIDIVNRSEFRLSQELTNTGKDFAGTRLRKIEDHRNNLENEKLVRNIGGFVLLVSILGIYVHAQRLRSTSSTTTDSESSSD